MSNIYLENECKFIFYNTIILIFCRNCKMKFKSADELANHVKKVSLQFNNSYLVLHK